MLNRTLYILIDASGSMRGVRADAINNVMSAVFEELLPKLSCNSYDLKINLAVLAFKGDNHIEWIIPKTDICDISKTWYPIDQEYFYGGTPTGAAIDAVIEDMDKGKYGEPDKGVIPPVILLISDGMPNGEDPTYEEVLERNDKNNPKFSSRYRYSTRIAIGINVDDDGRNSLQRFGRLTKSMEGLQAYYDCSDMKLDELVKIIKAVTSGATH